jgi:hypothetical protein
MPYEVSVLVPKDELTATDQKNYKTKAMEAGLKRATEKLGVGADELMVRHAENILDFGTALEQWNTAALAAVGTAYTVFQAIPAPTLANNKVAVFYKIGIQTVPPPVGLLTFRSGGAAGNIKAEFDLEQIANCLTPEGYFSEPIPMDPTETFAVQVIAIIATGVLARVQFGCYIIEPKGQRIASM